MILEITEQANLVMRKAIGYRIAEIGLEYSHVDILVALLTRFKVGPLTLLNISQENLKILKESLEYSVNNNKLLDNESNETVAYISMLIAKSVESQF